MTRDHFPERRASTLTRGNLTLAEAEVGPDPAALVRHLTGHKADAYTAAKWTSLLARAGRLTERRKAQGA